MKRFAICNLQFAICDFSQSQIANCNSKMFLLGSCRMETKKILVADDETHILNVVSMKLRNAGYEVVTARDGQEALEAALAELPDLIITDYHMPQMSGLELCQRLKQEPSTCGIPAIMLTARGYDLQPVDTAN